MENGGINGNESDDDMDVHFVPDFETVEESLKQIYFSGAAKAMQENPHADMEEDDEYDADDEDDEYDEYDEDDEDDEVNSMEKKGEQNECNVDNWDGEYDADDEADGGHWDTEWNEEIERIKIKTAAMAAVRQLERTVNKILTIDEQIKKLDQLQIYYNEALSKPPVEYNQHDAVEVENRYVWVRKQTPEELATTAEKAVDEDSDAVADRNYE